MLTSFGAGAALVGFLVADAVPVVIGVGFLLGGVANPLYSLLIAHTNDYLDHTDMAAASGGLLFINGLGAISGPLLIGWLMTAFGADAFFAYVGGLFALIALYAAYRTTRRAAPSVEQTSSYTPVLPQASPVALEVAQTVAIARASEDTAAPANA
jgi:MFS family permease